VPSLRSVTPTAKRIIDSLRSLLASLATKCAKSKSSYEAVCPIDEKERTMKILVVPTTGKLTLSHIMWKAIFGDHDAVQLRDGTIVKKKSISNLRSFETKNYLFLEQNPNSRSKFAIRAQLGERIMWIIKKIPGQVRGRYIGRVEEGNLITQGEHE